MIRNEVKFYKGKVTKELFSKTPHDLNSGWYITLPGLDSSCFFDVIINDIYVFSVNNIAPLHNFLYSKVERIDYYRANEILSLMSYLFDSPTVISAVWYDKDVSHSHLHLQAYFDHMGMKHLTDSRKILENTVSLCEEIHDKMGDNYSRLEPFPEIVFSEVYTKVYLTSNKKLMQALNSYRLALLSSTLQSQFVHYWRALEAITDLPQRKLILNNFDKFKFQSLWGKLYHRDDPEDRINIMTKHKRFCCKLLKNYRKRMDDKDIINLLYFERRNPSAHADRDDLVESNELILSRLFEDALLMKMIARKAIEEFAEKNKG